MTDFTTIETSDLEHVDGGSFATMYAGFRHGAFEAYKNVVSVPTAIVGGWKLAGQMYGDKVTLHDRFRAMNDVRHVLAASETLPAWAHR